MSSKNSNKINVPEARAAMDKFKMEAASDQDASMSAQTHLKLFRRKSVKYYLKSTNSRTKPRSIFDIAGFHLNIWRFLIDASKLLTATSSRI